MMLSNVPKKKLLFSILIIIALALILWGGFKGYNYVLSYIKDRELKAEQAKIELYERKIESLNKSNIVLISQINILNREVDSLKRIKTKIYWKHENEITIIYDASAVDHAIWMDTVVTKLKHFKNK